MDAEIARLKKQQTEIHAAKSCCASSFNFINSANLYSELLFDFVDTYFTNILDYEIQVEQKLQDVKKFPSNSSISQ